MPRVKTPTDARHQIIPLPAEHESSVIKAAIDLHRRGFHVVPQLYDQASGLPWKSFARLEERDLELVFAGRCNVAVVCGRLSNYLFVLNCLTDRAFFKMIDQFDARSLPVWAVRKPEGGYVWAQSVDGEVENALKGILDIQVFGTQNYVLCPPSVIASGPLTWFRQDGWLPASISVRDVDWLENEEGHPVVLTARGNKTNCHPPETTLSNPLGQTTRQFMEAPETLDDPGRALYAAACDLAGLGFSRDESERYLAASADAAGLPERRFLRALADVYRRQRQPAWEWSQDDNIRRYRIPHYALAYSRSQIWKGRNGSTDQAVFEALVTLLQRTNHPDGLIRGSLREVAEGALRTSKTAGKSLKRLMDAGLIERVGSDHASGANMFRFTEVTLARGRKLLAESFVTTPPIPSLLGSFSGVIAKDSDALERGALSQNANLIYTFLLTSGQPHTGPEIARHLRMSSGKIYGSMLKLQRYNMVQHLGKHRGYKALPVTTEQIEAIAERAGTKGKGKQRQAGNTRDRVRQLIASIVKFRAEQDVHFPYALQRPKTWRCDCGDEVYAKVSDLSPVCYSCGTMSPWHIVQNRTVKTWMRHPTCQPR